MSSLVLNSVVMIGKIDSAIFHSIPSPEQSVWHLGPFPLRAYALLILLGIAVACFWGNKRYIAKGGDKDTVLDAAVWAVIFGILGARVYAVVTTPSDYIGPGKDPLQIFKIWEGGIGILGAVAGGAAAIYVYLHRKGLRFGPFIDAIAPGVLVAQAIGRWGNYFNQELYGTPTNLPWALEISPEHLIPGYPVGTTFHPTFLYESLWNLFAAALLIYLERRFRLGGGQVALVYLMLYSFGRGWIEIIRTDSSLVFLGVRLNTWAAIIVFIGAGVAFLWHRKYLQTHPELREITFQNQEHNLAANSDPEIISDVELEISETGKKSAIDSGVTSKGETEHGKSENKGDE
ncbi:MAG: prolipoprotein diacylglyceryl transferase [Arcanobacterium sp.]|nr:prolipoprotein diacylglyceryl transferase [Arcanobacterium sp.]